MEPITILTYIAIIPLVIVCYNIVHRLVSSHIADVDLHNLKVVQLPNKKTDNYKIRMSTFLEHGPIEYHEYIYKNGQAIAFYTTKFRLVTSLIDVLSFASIIWGIIIFSRISIYRVDITNSNIICNILDYFIGGYFLVWLYFLNKMRKVTIAIKLEYNRYIS
jgi:hypothetical protein